MPDFTIQPMWTCATNRYWLRLINGSKDNIYEVTFEATPQGPCQYDYKCSCPAFKFKKGYCKHIVAVRNERCGYAPEGFNQQSSFHGCPSCEGEIAPIAVAL